MGLPPQVAGKASLFLVCFSKIASTVVYVMNNALNVNYGLWVGLWASLGGFAGAFILITYIKFGGRQSTLVWILVFEFCLAIAINDAYGFMQTRDALNLG